MLLHISSRYVLLPLSLLIIITNKGRYLLSDLNHKHNRNSTKKKHLWTKSTLVFTSQYTLLLFSMSSLGANHHRKCILTKMTKDWGLGSWGLEVPRRSGCGGTRTILLWTWGSGKLAQTRSFQLIQNLGAGDVCHFGRCKLSKSWTKDGWL